MFSHITLCPVPKNGEVVGKGQFRLSYHITEVLNVSQGQRMRFARGCLLFYHKCAAADFPLVQGPEKKVGGKGNERRTAKMEGEGMRAWEKKGTGEGWGEVKPYSPWPTVAPVPILDLLLFQWLVLLPQLWEQQPVYRKQAGCAYCISLGWGGRESCLFLVLRKPQLTWRVWALRLTSSHPYLLPSSPALPHSSLSCMDFWWGWVGWGSGGGFGSHKSCGIPGNCATMLWLNPWGLIPAWCPPPFHP